MEKLQAFKFKIEPNGSQSRLMTRTAGACRFVYNRMLANQNERYENGEKRLSYADSCKFLTEWKKSEEMAWLSLAPAQCLQQSLRHLEQGFKNYFSALAKAKDKGTLGKVPLDFEHPTFKKKFYSKNSFKYPDPKQFEVDTINRRIKLPKVGWIRYRGKQKIEGEIRSVTVSLKANEWHISILTRREITIPVHEGGQIGIDLGIARFATLSDGTFFQPKNAFKGLEKDLAKAQRSLKNKKKFSKNWVKGQKKVAKIHGKIANSRQDYLHKTSIVISKNHAMIAMEDLKVSNMSRSASGTRENPGKNVAAKSGLNKAILDQGWYEFRRQVEYKSLWQGGHVVLVPPHNTSRTCPYCHHIAKENRLSQAEFKCQACGYENKADVVGALNVLRAGNARLACEVSGTKPPATGTHRRDLCRASNGGIDSVGIPGL